MATQTTLVFTNLQSGASVSLSDSNVLTATVQGVEGSAELNIYKVKITRRDGEKTTASDYAARPITLDGKIVCSSPGDLRAKIAALKGIVAGSGYLDVTFYGDSTKRYKVNVKNWIVTNSSYLITWVPFTLNLETDDSPFGEDISSTTIFSNSAVNADVEQVSNLGGSAEPRVAASIRIPTIGSLTGLEFRNITTNTGLIVQPTFNPQGNDTFYIDTGDKTCTLNGLPVKFNGIVPTFQTGNNDWRLNFLTSGITIDTQQTAYNTDEYIGGNIVFAQSFQPSASINCHRIDLMLARLGNPTSISISIHTDSIGQPSGTVLAGSTSTVLASNVTTSPGYVSFYLQNVTALTSGTTYWIIATASSGDTQNGFYMKTSNQNPVAYKLARALDGGTLWDIITNNDAVFRVWKTTVMSSYADTSEETITESFVNTTEKDAVATTATWDTTSHKLIMGTASTSNSGFVSPTVTPGTGYLAYNFWTNPTNAYAADGVYATHTTGPATQMSSDAQTYQGFSFGVPAGSVVTGFDITVKGLASATATLQAYLLFDYNNDGAVNIFDFSTMLNNAMTVNLTTTNTQTTVSFPSGSWPSTILASGQFTLVLYPNAGNISYSIDLAQVKVYYTTYDATKNVGQSIALVTTDAPHWASARIQATETDPTGTSMAYAIQNDGTNGFIPASNNVTDILPVPVLGTAPSNKWRAMLTGSTSASPYITGLSIYFRGAMPLGATTDRLAQAFNSGAGGTISQLLFNLVKTAPSSLNYTVEIQTDSSSNPSGTVITNGTATISGVNVPDQQSGGDFTWTSATFATAPSLTASTVYWIVIRITSADSTKLLWRARGGNTLSTVSNRYSTNSGTAWHSQNNQDFLYQIFSSGTSFSANVTLNYKARN